MEITSPEIQELLRAIENWLQLRPHTPNDFETLSVAIWQHTRKQISSSTLKRLWGYVSNTSTVHCSTLDILAQCVGANDWNDFTTQLKERNGLYSDFILDYTLRTIDLQIGDKIAISWQPNRHCQLNYQGKLTFIVEQAKNTKLAVGDTFQCAYFINGKPLYVDRLIHNNQEPTSFVMGLQGGLTEIVRIAV